MASTAPGRRWRPTSMRTLDRSGRSPQAITAKFPCRPPPREAGAVPLTPAQTSLWAGGRRPTWLPRI
ncbi:MAG: hypothetical protein QOK20_2586 [Acidimicrobiaceae bacterium]|nr:hypothetical protein [Acidimicrobiaceae bacterium]